MPSTIIPSQFFLPFDLIKLGRLVTNIHQPNEGFHDPFNIEGPQSVVSDLLFSRQSQQNTNANFGSALESLMSLGLSRRVNANIEVAPASGRRYFLNNSDDWFDKAVSIPATRAWIEKAAIRGRAIYLIVGITSLTNTRITASSARDRTFGGQVDVPISLALNSVGIPLLGPLDPAVVGNFQDVKDIKSELFAPGEQVCALQYRKVRFKWFSRSQVILSKTRQWLCTEGDTRDLYDDIEDEEGEGEDGIEVSIEDMNEPDGEWHSEHVGGEEVVLVLQ